MIMYINFNMNSKKFKWIDVKGRETELAIRYISYLDMLNGFSAFTFIFYKTEIKTSNYPFSLYYSIGV